MGISFYNITKRNKSQPVPLLKTGFTIVELLIVVVVIAILAAVTIVSYNGITSQAQESAVKTDLSQASKKLEIYKISNTDYPSGNSSNAFELIGYSGDADTTYSYATTDTGYCLSAVKGDKAFFISNSTGSPSEGDCQLAIVPDCPSGFIAVPGSSVLGTDDFCVMKYEAKNNGSDVAVSTASGDPWTNLTQVEARYAAMTACDNCDLISEEEWMTVAANVLRVPSNWSGGAVGSGYIYSGHNDNSPSYSLDASADDNDGYYRTNNSSGDQRRTLTLTNGEVVWDLSGNVFEWTMGRVTADDIGMPGEYSFNWYPWKNESLSLGNLPEVSRPSALEGVPGLSGISDWGASMGIGRLFANYGDSGYRAFYRSGRWNNGIDAGVLSLSLNYSTNSSSSGTGFRATAPVE